MEIWRLVDGFPGYEVSNQGRVRSLDRIVAITDKKGVSYTRAQRGCILQPRTFHTGHLRVSLGAKNEQRRIHHLVLEVFLGPCPDGMECRHLDGNPTNNAFSNLVWDTRSNNTRDKKWHNGTKDHRLKPIEVLEIKDRLSRYYRGLICELAREFGVTHGAICAIKRGQVHIDVHPQH